MNIEFPAQLKRFQFTTFNILVATFWSAVFCCGLVLRNYLAHYQIRSLRSEDTAYLVAGFLLFVSLPAAIDGLFGRALRGMFVGFTLFMVFLLVLNTWTSL